MKPLQIGLLVVAGALFGAVVMRFAQRPKPEPPVVTAYVPPEPARVPPAASPTAPAAAEPVSPPAAPVEVPPAEPVPSRLPLADARGPETSARSRDREGVVSARHPSPFAERPVSKPRPPIITTARVRPVYVPARPADVPQAAPMRPLPAPPAAAPATAPDPLPPAAEPAAPQPATTTPTLPPVRSDAENATPALPQAPPPPPPNKVTLNAGLLIPVRLVDGLSSERNQAGDTFRATLERELVANGFVIAERGARVEGRVVAADRGGKASGVASLAVALTWVFTSDGQAVAVQTDPFNRHADQSHVQDAATIGGGAALGAIVGAMAGGGKGAAVGAGVGAGAGAAAVVLTRGGPAALPSESRVTFRLKAPVTVTERR